MEEYSGWLVIIAIGAVIYHWSAVTSWKARAEHVANTRAYRNEAEERIRKLTDEVQQRETRLAADRNALSRQREHFDLVMDRTKRIFPWAAKIHGDLLEAEADQLSRMLAIKKHPALKASEELQRFKTEARERLERSKYGAYKAMVYETAFPFLVDFIEGAPTSDLAVSLLPAGEVDPVRSLLSEQEYARMSSAERSQHALERYLRRPKSNWEIGRAYERYIGYQYEVRGWEIEFHGAIQGVEDLGRDLIARRGGETLIIQCKYWSQWKNVHENAIFQLFGSVVDYVFECGYLREGSLLSDDQDVFSALRLSGVRGVFVTSTQLSPRAQLACKALRLQVDSKIPLERYPMIKCNVSRDGERLYHLPFDQQYDRVKIEAEKGEFYAETGAEAEEKGFRRVYRWKSSPVE